MFTLSVAWPQCGSPSVLAGLSMHPSIAAPLFSTCVILCAPGMNSITRVACFLLSLLFSTACIACFYNTGDQHLPQALGSERRGDFFPCKATQHGSLTSQVTVVIKSWWGPWRAACVYDVGATKQ